MVLADGWLQAGGQDIRIHLVYHVVVALIETYWHALHYTCTPIVEHQQALRTPVEGQALDLALHLNVLQGHFKGGSRLLGFPGEHATVQVVRRPIIRIPIIGTQIVGTLMVGDALDKG